TNEIGAAHFGVRIVDVAGPEIALASARVVVVALKFAWPDAVVRALDGVGQLALAVPPVSLLIKRGPRQKWRLILPVRVDPAVACVVEHHVEQDADAALVCFPNQLHHVVTGAKARIDFEEVLDGVAVIAIKVRALLERRTDPERGYAEPFKVVELRRDSLECATLKTARARRGPLVPAKPGRPVRLAMGGIDERPAQFPAIAEAVGQQEVNDLIAPIGGRGEETRAARQRYCKDAVGTSAAEAVIGEAHGDTSGLVPHGHGGTQTSMPG